MEKHPKNTWQRRGIFALMSREDNADILGSYTGTPKNPDDEQPVQDADDL